MASEHSLDISAKIDLQAFKDAIAQAEKEAAGRYDFKGITYEINYREKEKQLILLASSDNKLDALKDIVIGRLVKRGLSSKVLEELKTEDASGGNRKATYKIVDAIEAKEAKKIVAEIKNMKTKATAQIEGDHIRVKSKQIDELQKIMAAIKAMEWEAPLVFDNFR
ncbi:YajQ family cyclic di-GMP-binding protein [Sulfuricurvum sp. IAE1]|uniref:YajQ family cyclic di-GMP-binding protein n=1 Tax=Sulfuricurvum sp. IAE1 TaxID=2546102 RepID=UPI0010532477|nr:YajQ family cyclic di-GMP-binding protein [Sulfuricurvum sp. IAE1]MDD3770751.1 YajQ family cyclic di-GMP-binding protein [Sulfuricurvum sp.]TDA68439.1 YajQ family cyclic di-GMP-binding protein [Sulfuricurvum sp. IAE1]